ncbi:hypothetical protein HpCK35_32100 [Helicobacter pylori]
MIVLAKEYLNLKVEEREILMDELGMFREAGACGTAAIITPIKEIVHNNKSYFFETPGNTTKQLYDLLLSIQQVEQKAPKDWIFEVC